MRRKQRTTTAAQRAMVKDPIVTFSSQGGVGKTHFSGNNFKLLDQAGSPWDSGQDGLYGHEAYHIRLDNYFADAIWNAFDYFRVTKCETTVSWRSAPEVGPLMGDLFYYIDKDSPGVPTVPEIANRRDLNHHVYSNDNHVCKVNWTPHVVSREQPFEDPVQYVHPASRWLNTQEVTSLRFGTFVLLATTPNGGVQYVSTPSVSIRHKITIELKGQRSPQPIPAGTTLAVSQRVPGEAPKPEPDSDSD